MKKRNWNFNRLTRLVSQSASIFSAYHSKKSSPSPAMSMAWTLYAIQLWSSRSLKRWRKRCRNRNTTKAHVRSRTEQITHNKLNRKLEKNNQNLFFLIPIRPNHTQNYRLRSKNVLVSFVSVYFLCKRKCGLVGMRFLLIFWSRKTFARPSVAHENCWQNHEMNCVAVFHVILFQLSHVITEFTALTNHQWIFDWAKCQNESYFSSESSKNDVLKHIEWQLRSHVILFIFQSCSVFIRPKSAVQSDTSIDDGSVLRSWIVFNLQHVDSLVWWISFVDFDSYRRTEYFSFSEGANECQTKQFEKLWWCSFDSFEFC